MQDEKRIRLRVVSVMTEPDGTRHENQSVHRGTLRAAAEGPEIVYEQVARGEETAQIHGVATRAVGSYHDDRGGALRGRNNVRIFRIDALKVVHMGDQGCMPDETVMQAILDADVMMIPVGGFYTIDAKGAKAIIEQARPKCVIPMHYKTAHCTYPIAGVEPFLGAMDAENVKPVRELEVRPGNVPEGVVVMEALEEF